MTKQHEGNPERSEGAADLNKCTPSTIWEWRRVRVGTSPAAGQHSAPKELRWWHLRPWPRREWLTIRVKYRGGSECWIELESRGSKGRYPGSVSLLDALEEVWGVNRREPEA